MNRRNFFKSVVGGILGACGLGKALDGKPAAPLKVVTPPDSLTKQMNWSLCVTSSYSDGIRYWYCYHDDNTQECVVIPPNGQGEIRIPPGGWIELYGGRQDDDLYILKDGEPI